VANGAQGRRRSDDLVMESDPIRDSFGRAACGPQGTVRMLGVRCQEAQSQSLPNQDYAYLRMAADGSSLSFCVCDGVGSSYKGDFAAKYLAIRLANWLHALEDIGAAATDTSDVEPLRAQLVERLAGWAAAGQRDLQTLTLPEDNSGLVREVLQETRDSYGSEAVFFAGRIDVLHVSDTVGLPGAQVLLCWMGNVTPYLFAAEGRRIALDYHPDDAVRWSTARGLRGTLALRAMRLDALHRLVIHTDGLDMLGASIASLSDEELYHGVRALLARPSNDDMTLLDMFWQSAGERSAEHDRDREGAE